MPTPNQPRWIVVFPTRRQQLSADPIGSLHERQKAGVDFRNEDVVRSQVVDAEGDLSTELGYVAPGLPGFRLAHTPEHKTVSGDLWKNG